MRKCKQSAILEHMACCVAWPVDACEMPCSWCQGRLNQWAHWARAHHPGFFLFEGLQLAVVK